MDAQAGRELDGTDAHAPLIPLDISQADVDPTMAAAFAKAGITEAATADTNYIEVKTGSLLSHTHPSYILSRRPPC